MPRINISIDELAQTIMELDEHEMDTLSIMLNQMGNELLNRKDDLERGKIKSLTRDEIFDV